MMEALNDRLGYLSQNSNERDFEPLLFDLSKGEERNAFDALISDNNHLLLTNDIEGQLKELVKLRRPEQQSFTDEEVKELIESHLNGMDLDLYGLWVYYPWSNRLVHILPENEFIEVRTNRNRNKITQEESELLSKKKVGVIGLSVGQSVSVTMAMERSFGEIRLADFDKLELTNLNRIRTGLYNLGIPKVISVAREIKEIDPFLHIKIFEEGITEHNIDGFFNDGGMLDAVIDECDGLDIKVLCRVKAKEFHVPVLMEASDRGTIDVERYDLEPDRPLLHGFIDHLDISKIKDLKTNEEKVPYLLPIAGIETLSKKMKASMLEIGQSLTTWPQLSSAVTLGGGITADTYRRMMLDEFHASGRFFVDLEDILVEVPSESDQLASSDDNDLVPLSMAHMKNLIHDLNLNGVDRAEMSDELARNLVSAAITAPSAGNNQPWKWVHKDNALFLFHDRSRSVSFSDYGDMGSMLAFGACIENIALTAYKLGYDLNINYFPIKNDARLICRLTIVKGIKNDIQESLAAHDLVSHIGERHTNRAKADTMKLTESDINALNEIVSLDPEHSFHFTDQETEIETMAEVVAACERLRIMHPSGHFDFYQNEVRWTDDESKESGDGIDIATVELTESELAGMKLASDPKVVDYLRKWKGGKGFEKLSREAVESSPVVGLIRGKNFELLDFIHGGRVLQRFWLMATKLGLSVHPISAGLFMFARLFHGLGVDLKTEQREEIQALHDQFKTVFPEQKGHTDLFMFRIFKSSKSVVRSYRLPLDEVLNKL